MQIPRDRKGRPPKGYRPTGREPKAASATAWRRTPEGQEKYRAAKASAQAAADADGMDRGIEWRDGPAPYCQAVAVFLLPRKHNRFGHEHTCEVVSCTNPAKTKPGHGPCATRPPSLVGPEYHGGPFDYERNRKLAAEWHVAHPQFDCDFGTRRAVSPFDRAHEALKAELAHPFYRS